MGAVAGDILAGLDCAAVAGVRLALVFILTESALSALRDRSLFAAVIEDYRVIPRFAAAPATIIVPVCELAVALMLASPLSQLGGLCAAMLFGGFAWAMAVNLLRGRDSISCGCGGGASLPISWALVGRNAVLIAASVAVAASLSHVGGSDLWAAEVGFAVFIVALYFAANQLIGNARALSRVAHGGRRA